MAKLICNHPDQAMIPELKGEFTEKHLAFVVSGFRCRRCGAFWSMGQVREAIRGYESTGIRVDPGGSDSRDSG
jgi:hypothetical protein